MMHYRKLLEAALLLTGLAVLPCAADDEYQGSQDSNSQSPMVLDYKEPIYPENLREKGIQGTVGVGLLVGPDGTVKGCWVESSSGYPEMNIAALEAVRQWKFLPAEKNGKAVAEKAFVFITFRLQKNR